MKTKLNKTKHPYYCNEGNYFASNDETVNYVDSWDEFLEDMADADDDYNMLFRWDWEKIEDGDEDENGEIIKLFFMIQRKGYHLTYVVAVTSEDEPRIRSYLEPKWEHLKKVWEGIS